MKQVWLKFYPGDWRSDPALRMCSLSARGLWMEMLALMHDAEPRGFLTVNGRTITAKQLASLAGCSTKEAEASLAELEEAGVFSRSEDSLIFSRRMVRDIEKDKRDRENGKGGGHPDIKRGTVPKEARVRRFRRSDAPAKAQRIFDRSAGACHWCQKELEPEHYHIDHVIAVRDGGTNEEENLVASCPDCNGERAMVWGRKDSDLKVGNGADHKAQNLEARDQSLSNLTVACPKRVRTKVEYHEKFEALWRAFPTDALMSKQKAYAAWMKLEEEDQAAVLASVSSFKTYCRTHADYRAVHLVRYISERRFDGFSTLEEQVSSSVAVREGTPQWKAWDSYWRHTEGKGPPCVNGSWRFPSEWPPEIRGAHAA